jgi:hypothetical protein
MSLNTYLPGRLRNTYLPAKDGLLPLFEAVLNSIQAIEDADGLTERGQVRVHVIRGPVNLELEYDKKKRGPDPLGPITGFDVYDDGVGFDANNMLAFETLDTDYKSDRGGRGVGRLLWLKAFKEVRIESHFRSETSEIRRREFTFDPVLGVANQKVTEAQPGSRTRTTVHLAGFKEKYRVAVFKTADAMARALLEHCLWYFVRPGGAPTITIVDGDQTVDLSQLYDEHMEANAVSEKIVVKGRDFELLHVKLRSGSSSTHQIAYCADQRVVSTNKIAGKVPGVYGPLSDNSHEFTYSCYVSSEFLDENVRSERTGIDLPESIGELFEDTELSWKDIEQEVCLRIAAHLRDFLAANREKSRERVAAFVATKAPRYRPIVSRIPEDQLLVDPDITDKDLELALHRQLADLEQQLLADGHDLMSPYDEDSIDTYRKRLDDYLARAEDIKRSDLASYVSHRKVILDLLESALERGPDGRHKREDVLHAFIMPMRVDSNHVRFESCNLWLVDERLAFHDYLASDKPLSSMPITGSQSQKEPDLVALNIFDNPTLVSEGGSGPSASLVIVEIKRPMRNDAGPGEKDDPIEQALGYLDRIRQGKVTTSRGRLIPNSADIPGFCYVVCDITPTIEQRCKYAGMVRRSDGLGYFKYNEPMKAYVEVISFDGLVKAAKQRNRAFFEKLGLPAT